MLSHRVVRVTVRCQHMLTQSDWGGEGLVLGEEGGGSCQYLSSMSTNCHKYQIGHEREKVSCECVVSVCTVWRKFLLMSEEL